MKTLRKFDRLPLNVTEFDLRTFVEQHLGRLFPLTATRGWHGFRAHLVDTSAYRGMRVVAPIWTLLKVLSLKASIYKNLE